MPDNRKNLNDFIIKTYPKRGFLFSTSFTTCSLMETQEEELIAAVLQDEDDWLGSLPDLVFSLAREFDPEKELTDLYAMFLGDAIRDLFSCHVREA